MEVGKEFFGIFLVGIPDTKIVDDEGESEGFVACVKSPGMNLDGW